MITISDDTIHADTSTLTAAIRNGLLVSLRSKLDGQEYIDGQVAAGSALQLYYPGQGTIDVMGNLASTIHVHSLSPNRAQVRFSGWDADGVLDVSEDPETGDLVMERLCLPRSLRCWFLLQRF